MFSTMYEKIAKSIAVLWPNRSFVSKFKQQLLDVIQLMISKWTFIYDFIYRTQAELFITFSLGK